LDREALRLQPPSAARQAWTQRSVRLELFLIGPAALVVPAPQIRNQPFELPAGSEQQRFARFSWQLAERDAEIDAEVARQRLQLLANEFAIATRPRHDRALGQRLRFIRHHARGVDVHHRSESLAAGTRAVRRIE